MLSHFVSVNLSPFILIISDLFAQILFDFILFYKNNQMLMKLSWFMQTSLVYVYMCTVHRVIFAPGNIRPETALLKRAIIWDVGICLILNLTADNEGEKGKNRIGANISLYTYLWQQTVECCNSTVKLTIFTVFWFQIYSPNKKKVLMNLI